MAYKIIKLLFIPLLFISCQQYRLSPLDQDQHQVIQETFKQDTKTLEQIIQESPKKRYYLRGSGIKGDFIALSYLMPLFIKKNITTLYIPFFSEKNIVKVNDYLQNKELLNREETLTNLLFLNSPYHLGFQEYRDLLILIKQVNLQFPNQKALQLTAIKKEAQFIYSTKSDEKEIKQDFLKILIHQPLPIKKNKFTIPFQGKLYLELERYQSSYLYKSIILNKSSLGNFYLTKEDEKEKRPVKEKFDILLFSGPIKSLTPLTPIANFISEKNALEAQKDFPHLIIRSKARPASYFMNRQVQNQLKKEEKILNTIKKELSFNL